MTTTAFDEQFKTLEDFLRINEERLPFEWANQPLRYINVARMTARAAADISELKLTLAIWSAEQDQAVRAAPLPAGVTRLTEAGIDNIIKTKPEYAQHMRAIAAKTEEYDILEKLCRAFEQRERALKHLTFFIGGGSDPEDGFAAARAAAAAAANAKLAGTAGS